MTQAISLRNDQLLFQIKRLKQTDAAEARARNELGMIKKDETFYQIVPVKSSRTNDG